MASFDLASIVRRARNIRRRAIVFREIKPTGLQATQIYTAAYRPVINLWLAALPRIEAEYARSLADIVTDSPSDIGRILDDVAAGVTRMFITIRPSLASVLFSIEAWHRSKWRSAILTATGVDLGTLLGPEMARDTLGAVLERNVGLVQSVSDEARRRISETVFAGFNQRKPAADIAKDIREAVAMSRRRALRIAGDQVVKLASSLDQERRREAGLDVWEWRHSGKLHPREWHRARNGVFYSEDKARIDQEIDGKTVRASPSPDDLPGQQPFCGCTSRAVLTFD